MAPEAISPAEADAVVALIAGEQARPERQITYVGATPEGIRAELDGLDPPWTETARVVRDRDGAITGVSIVEYDEELGRAWILGPWVAGDAAAWDDFANPLLDAALVQLPAGVPDKELSGDVANALLAELAVERGWRPTAANHALVADAEVVAAWPDVDVELRAPRPGDAAAIAPLHDAEFPKTYASAEQLVAGHAEGSRVMLVADAPGGVDGAGAGVAGYAAGKVQEDGEGYIDFLAVNEAARGAGVGRRLVVGLTRELLARSTAGRVLLTVQDHREPARALYERLGFRPDGSFVVYRSWPA